MIKTVNQQIIISQEIRDLMSKFRNMVNDCIRIGLQNNVTSLKTLSAKSNRYLVRYDILSYYKIHAISRASGILQNRKKSIKRGFKTKTLYLKDDMIISCYGFKVDRNYGVLKIPLGGNLKSMKESSKRMYLNRTEPASLKYSNKVRTF